MSQNLTNVYAYLRDTFEDVNMLFAKPVSFIKTLVGPDIQKVIFVYKEVNIKEQHTMKLRIATNTIHFRIATR